MNHKNTTIHMLAIHVDKVKTQKSLRIKTSDWSSVKINTHNQWIFTYDCTTIYLSYYNLYSVIFFMKMSRVKCIMDKGVLPGILVCSEIFRGGMCISGGNANTIHNINLFSSNPHNNYSINEKKNEQWKIKSYQLLTYTCIMIKKYIEKVALWRKMIFFTV